VEYLTAASVAEELWRTFVSRLNTLAKEEEAPASSSTPSRHLLAASSGASSSINTKDSMVKSHQVMCMLVHELEAINQLPVW